MFLQQNCGVCADVGDVFAGNTTNQKTMTALTTIKMLEENKYRKQTPESSGRG